MRSRYSSRPPLGGGRTGLPHVGFRRVAEQTTGGRLLWGLLLCAALLGSAVPGRLGAEERTRLRGVTPGGETFPLVADVSAGGRLVLSAPDRGASESETVGADAPKRGSLVKIQGLSSLPEVGELYIVGLDYFDRFAWLREFPTLRILVLTNAWIPEVGDFFRLGSLEELFIVNSRIERPPADRTSLAEASSLRVLSFRGTELPAPPVLTDLPAYLEFLDLSNCGLDLRLGAGSTGPSGETRRRLLHALESYAGIEEVNVAGNVVDQTLLDTYPNLNPRRLEIFDE